MAHSCIEVLIGAATCSIFRQPRRGSPASCRRRSEPAARRPEHRDKNSSRGRRRLLIFHQVIYKVHVVVEAEARNIGHHVIRPARTKAFKTRQLLQRPASGDHGGRGNFLTAWHSIPRVNLRPRRRPPAAARERRPSRKSRTLRIAFVMCSGATAHPTRHPVTL